MCSSFNCLIDYMSLGLTQQLESGAMKGTVEQANAFPKVLNGLDLFVLPVARHVTSRDHGFRLCKQEYLAHPL